MSGEDVLSSDWLSDWDPSDVESVVVTDVWSLVVALLLECVCSVASVVETESIWYGVVGSVIVTGYHCIVTDVYVKDDHDWNSSGSCSG